MLSKPNLAKVIKAFRENEEAPKQTEMSNSHLLEQINITSKYKDCMIGLVANYSSEILLTLLSEAPDAYLNAIAKLPLQLNLFQLLHDELSVASNIAKNYGQKQRFEEVKAQIKVLMVHCKEHRPDIIKSFVNDILTRA